ncbi:hypothetical protein RDWZM_009728 [Blomia tropicalis]|uniref:Notch-regulated ankyrin repeat-containing protein n=1 Tax=Blomia tropicalis TaxID=40697 RepID=A0A9Q0RLC5_BLOTA|nr:hypothetical protein RDWZM_009728 [Blomia tropicalis]
MTQDLSTEETSTLVVRLSSSPSIGFTNFTTCDTENIDPKSVTICDISFNSKNDSNNHTTEELDRKTIINLEEKETLIDDPYKQHHYYHYPTDPCLQLTIDPEMHHTLPLSPSMTPPIPLSPSFTDSSSNDFNLGDDLPNINAKPSTSEADESSTVINSPMSIINFAEDEPNLEQQTKTIVSSPPKSFVRSRSIRRLRSSSSSSRYSPYVGVLRPINIKTKESDSWTRNVSSCDSDTTSVPLEANNADHTTESLATIITEKESSDCINEKPTTTKSKTPEKVSTIHKQLTVDTQLANTQSAIAHCETLAAKMALANRLLSVIRNGDFKHFQTIIQEHKPDLNVFVNGQTALHYCLTLGRDVSWCKQLVLNGANPNLSSQDGWHPLHLAAHHGLIENLTYLINCNSQQQINSHRHNIQAETASNNYR